MKRGDYAQRRGVRSKPVWRATHQIATIMRELIARRRRGRTSRSGQRPRMRPVEQHRIDRHDPRWRSIDAAAFVSKHLYNAALYVTRQAFIHQQRIITYEELARDMKTSEAYRALPAKVAQWVLRQVALA